MNWGQYPGPGPNGGPWQHYKVVLMLDHVFMYVEMASDLGEDAVIEVAEKYAKRIGAEYLYLETAG